MLELDKLKKQLKHRRQLLNIAKTNPLALAKLWIPYCCNWTGIKGERPEGCKRPMQKIKPGLYHCSTCQMSKKDFH